MGSFCTATKPPGCGDFACRADQGETPDNCRVDCVPDGCGDGRCRPTEGETEENCSEDCNNVCINEDGPPVYCKTDGGCWPEKTDCCKEIYTCGDIRLRCQGAAWALACCDNQELITCVESRFYCPAPGIEKCVLTEAECPIPVCQHLADCVKFGDK